MEEYISREAVLEHKTLIPGFIGEYVAVRDILEVPAANVAPVVEAEWVDVWGGKYANHLWRCSACREEAMDDDKPLSRTDFCPNCGARMKGGEN